MKMKNDKNRPASGGNFWRVMLGTAFLCLLTSLTSIGQTATLASLQALQAEIDYVENKLANPLVQANTSAASDLQMYLESLKGKYAWQKRELEVTNPAEFRALLESEINADNHQVIEQALEAEQLNKQAMQEQLDAEQAAAAGSGPALSPFSTPTSGYQSTDPNKIP